MNRILLISALLIIGSLFFSQCKKKTNQVNFKGTVVDPGKNEAVTDAKVTLASTAVQSWVYNSNFQDIASVNTAQDGSFEFIFDEQAASAYRIYIFKQNYFSNTTIINANEVTSDEAYNDTFELIPEALISLRIKNQAPVDSADRIMFRINKGAVVCPNGCPSDYIQGLGPDYDTTINCKTYGNAYFLLESNITKGGSTILHLDSVYLNPFVTTEFNIYY